MMADNATTFRKLTKNHSLLQPTFFYTQNFIKEKLKFKNTKWVFLGIFIARI
jgi:hypothetical protein